MSDEIRRRLDEAGRRPAPAPDPAFADALEARLRAVAASLPRTSRAPVPPPRDAGRGRWGIAGLAAVVAVLAIALAAGVLGPRPAPRPAPELGEPVNVEVALADGTVLEDPDGLLLPDGAVVTVGDGGSARIGDTILGPGDVATVNDGRLEVAHPSPVAVVPDVTAAPTPSPRPSATSRPVASSRPTNGPGRSATPTPDASEAPPTSAPGPTATPGRGTPTPVGPTPSPAVTDRPPTSAPTSAPTASPTPAPEVLRPRLRARLVDGPRIAVRWTETHGARSYVLLATAAIGGSAADPVYPGARVLGTFASPPERALRYRVPDRVTEVRLMVVALRRDGSVLRRSRVVIVTIPASDAAGDPGVIPEPTPSATATPLP